ncbi:TetR/AcrR family transcriptional regulator [Paenibacillus lupini]|uniref:TetR/AcrR family transcriptional regulator n=1 Tax=Paenibacillus lupini TaxID=1450204 RepID=UPI001FB91E85|nr:TetR/AcrR family transcriptional regulator [Paenibacillus lupini]NIK21905.1 TetR/AcrR family transcriptional repressor of nem operon [Paenibacillus lupini]
MARPREFDSEHVLQQAMHLFWSRGYEAVAIPDLLKQTGLSRSSLYEFFGDKQSLFIETLNHYKHIGDRKRDVLRNAQSVKEGIQNYFTLHIDMSVDEALPRGCFITNTAVSLDQVDDQVRRLIEERFEGLENEFYLLLEKGQQSGEITKDKNIVELARLFNGLNHGISVMARVNQDRLVLSDMVNAALKLL